MIISSSYILLLNVSSINSGQRSLPILVALKNDMNVLISERSHGIFTRETSPLAVRGSSGLDSGESTPLGLELRPAAIVVDEAQETLRIDVFVVYAGVEEY